MSTSADEVPPSVRMRQANCSHSFIKGFSDPTPRCPHCGISQADHERLGLQPFNPGIWTP